METIVVYSGRGGEPPVLCPQTPLEAASRCPLTVRLIWQADGTIRPLTFWTAEGACYDIKTHSQCVPLAYLKDRGEGLRFKVSAELVDAPELDWEDLYTRYDAYLYLADRRFSAPNLIDGRYGHTAKRYIDVVMDVFPDGDYELVYFWVEGLRYQVERTVAVAPRGSFYAGGVGLWHKVEARLVGPDDDEDPDPAGSVRRLAALYWELNKWFVCVEKNVIDPVVI